MTTLNACVDLHWQEANYLHQETSTFHIPLSHPTFKIQPSIKLWIFAIVRLCHHLPSCNPSTFLSQSHVSPSGWSLCFLTSGNIHFYLFLHFLLVHPNSHYSSRPNSHLINCKIYTVSTPMDTDFYLMNFWGISFLWQTSKSPILLSKKHQ